MTVATCALQALAGVSDDVRRELAHDIATAIRTHFQLSVQAAQSFGERGEGGWCDGVSIIDSGVILYRPTASRRQNFTLLHELGHHLVENSIECLSWIADQPDPNRVLEQVCDQVAADLLIPTTEIDLAIAGRTPGAPAVLALFEGTQASRSACAIAVARKLPCDGFVALVEEGSDEIFFAARARDTRPYAWRGDPIPTAHPLRRQPPPVQRKAWWPQTNGTGRREYYMSTATDRGWTIAVFTEDDLFGVTKLHLPQQVEEDRGYDGQVTCPCGYSGPTRWWPCKECGQSQCARCGECACARRAKQLVRCENCCVSVLPHLLEDGLCDMCG